MVVVKMNMKFIFTALFASVPETLFMKLEDQVCSLELSKRLKELGVKQESIFVWEYYDDQCHGVKFIPYAVVPDNYNKFQLFSAFTVGELGEILNSFENNLKNYELDFYTTYDNYNIVLKPNRVLDIECVCFYVKDILEANARAKMLVYLIESDLMK